MDICRYGCHRRVCRGAGYTTVTWRCSYRSEGDFSLNELKEEEDVAKGRAC